MLVRVRRLIERHELAIVVLLSLAMFVAGCWAFQLIDPWETHYGEVARRILQDDDWIHLKWQNEIFRSKPVLTPWLMAASMGSFGVATDGGYSGELVASDLAIFAVRLPFALFGAFGLVMTWWMLARLVSRRVAWLATAILATCPMYLLVARQAIPDMPLCATLMGAMACFAMAAHAGDEPLEPLWRRGRLRLDAHGIFFACLAAFTLWQALYVLFYFQSSPKLAPGLRLWQPGWLLAGGMLLVLVGLVASSFLWHRPRTRGQVWMYWFYFLLGVSVLGKGPPGIGLAGAICLFYLLLTGRWRLLRRLEMPRGVLITTLVALPWHLGMYFKDGLAFIRRYVFFDMLDRVSKPEFSNSGGTFDYYSSVLGVGMWPWIALVPAALVATLAARYDSSSAAGRVRLMVGIWSVLGMALFALSGTKFRHYILPLVPALAVLVGFWLDDVLSGRGGRVWLFVLFSAALSLLVTRDMMGEPKQIIELFMYRYDRPWPSGDPWRVDVSAPLLLFGLLAAATLLIFALPWRRARAFGLFGLLATTLGFSVWVANGYMADAAPHWGQRELHRTYYQMRRIHGVEIRYWSLRDLADEWGESSGDLEVKSFLPDGFRSGLPMTVRLLVPGAGVPGDAIEMRGVVSAVGDDRFSIAVPPAERSKVAELVARGRKQERGRARRPWLQVDADRLIAWQLNWRGENFWSSGEIYGETEDTRTVFVNADKEFLEYLKQPGRAGRTFFLITEAGRTAHLKSVLPTRRAKDTVDSLDTSSNKFTLLRFTL
jgi:4-amino-4-deoxy-L-arabinose transferase-like glycosyltransferase